MNLGVFSLYWDNVDPRMVEAQRAVCAKFGVAVQQHRINGLPHGAWMDWVMRVWSDAEVMLFLDIDCIPLDAQSFSPATEAAHGTLIGAEGAANHLDPSRSYAAPWYLFVPRKRYEELGRPSAQPTSIADVGQRITDVWKFAKKPVILIPPTQVEHPLWDLPGRPKAYGIGTTYGAYCYHQFESRAVSAPFLAKCKDVLGEHTI